MLYVRNYYVSLMSVFFLNWYFTVIYYLRNAHFYEWSGTGDYFC